MKYVSWACVWLIAAAINADDQQVPDPAADDRSVSQRADGLDAGMAAAAGHDWPGIRGPHWNGHADETGLADSWPPEGPPVLWTRALGQGYSAFSGVVESRRDAISESQRSIRNLPQREHRKHALGIPIRLAIRSRRALSRAASNSNVQGWLSLLCRPCGSDRLS